MLALENRTETESWEDDEQTSPTPRLDVLKWCDSYPPVGESNKINPRTEYIPSNPFGYLDFIRNVDALKTEPLAGCDLTSLWKEMQMKWDISKATVSPTICEDLSDYLDRDIHLTLVHTPVLTVGDLDINELRFRTLAEQWYAETGMISMIHKKAMHPAYQKIIGMGKDALPFIFQEMKKNQIHWLWALTAIHGEDIAKPGCSLKEAVELWMKWGTENGYA